MTSGRALGAFLAALDVHATEVIGAPCQRLQCDGTLFGVVFRHLQPLQRVEMHLLCDTCGPYETRRRPAVNAYACGRCDSPRLHVSYAAGLGEGGQRVIVRQSRCFACGHTSEGTIEP